MVKQRGDHMHLAFPKEGFDQFGLVSGLKTVQKRQHSS